MRAICFIKWQAFKTKKRRLSGLRFLYDGTHIFSYLRFLIEERISAFKSYLPVVNNLFRTSNKKESARFQALLELTEYLILRFLRKINQNITADNQMIVRWISIF